IGPDGLQGLGEFAAVPAAVGAARALAAAEPRLTGEVHDRRRPVAGEGRGGREAGGGVEVPARDEYEAGPAFAHVRQVDDGVVEADRLQAVRHFPGSEPGTAPSSDDLPGDTGFVETAQQGSDQRMTFSADQTSRHTG